MSHDSSIGSFCAAGDVASLAGSVLPLRGKLPAHDLERTMSFLKSQVERNGTERSDIRTVGNWLVHLAAFQI